MSTKHYCDRCGSEMSIKAGRYQVGMDRYTAEDEFIENDIVMDLCGSCVLEIRKKTERKHGH